MGLLRSQLALWRYCCRLRPKAVKWRWVMIVLICYSPCLVSSKICRSWNSRSIGVMQVMEFFPIQIYLLVTSRIWLNLESCLKLLECYKNSFYSAFGPWKRTIPRQYSGLKGDDMAWWNIIFDTGGHLFNCQSHPMQLTVGQPSRGRRLPQPGQLTIDRRRAFGLSQQQHSLEGRHGHSRRRRSSGDGSMLSCPSLGHTNSEKQYTVTRPPLL